MIFARTILAALIALSLVALPASGEALVASPSTDRTDMVMVDQRDMPCCPRRNTQDNPRLITCALKCIGFVGVMFPAAGFAPPYLDRDVSPPFVDGRLDEFLRAPPTHPPQA